jgi:AbrB family looped-hinge helix DNA binding protein
MSKVKVGSRYQITVPAEIRQCLGINRGDNLRIELHDGGILLTPESGHAGRGRSSEDEERNSALRLLGLHKEVWEGVDVMEYINELRGEWPE